MSQVVVLSFLTIFYLSRAVVHVLNKKSPYFLFVSFFVVSVPFYISKPIWTYDLNALAGTIWPIVALSIPLVLIFILLLPKVKLRGLNLFTACNNWTRWVLLFVIISYFNPLNSLGLGTIAFFIFFLSHILLFHLLYLTIDKRQIWKGLYDGFLVLSFVNFVLAICFPVLNITAVTTLFHSGGMEGATRSGTRVGAIGVFVHPGNLALFTMMASSIFLSSYLNKFQKNNSAILLLMNAVTLFFTFSRTSYMTYVVVMFLIFFVKGNVKKKIFTISNILKFVIPVAALIVWVVYFSPISSLFLDSDSSEMYEARVVHWFLAFDMFSLSPAIGVGINNHLAYMFNNASLLNALGLEDFFLSNPIHNIHLIVLTETGILGFVFWVGFIFMSFKEARMRLFRRDTDIYALAYIGVLAACVLYGFTGWAPFSVGILPFFLMMAFFTLRYNR